MFPFPPHVVQSADADLSPANCPVNLCHLDSDWSAGHTWSEFNLREGTQERPVYIIRASLAATFLFGYLITSSRQDMELFFKLSVLCLSLMARIVLIRIKNFLADQNRD